MEKVLEEKVEKWITASNTVSDMYLKLIAHEQDNNLDEEYEAIKSLLPKAIEFEKKALDEIGITRSNSIEIHKMVAIDHQYELDVEQDIIGDFSEVRKNRLFCDYALNNVDFNINPELAEIFPDLFDSLKNIIDNIFLNREYESITASRVKLNQIYVIDKLIQTTEEEKVRNYLIYLKYFLIAVNPMCESAWLGYRQRILPPTNILVNFPPISQFDDLSVTTHLRKDIIGEITHCIKILADLNNFDMYALTNGFYLTSTYLEALLVSFHDICFVDFMETLIDSNIKDGILYTEIRKHLKQVFDNAKTTIKIELGRQKRRTKKNGK